MKRLLAVLAVVAVLGLTVPIGVGAAVNYFNATRTVSGTGTVACPHGYHVTGGGVTLPARPFAGSASSWTFETLGESRPTKNGWTATAYIVTVREGQMYGLTTIKPKVYAVCVT